MSMGRWPSDSFWSTSPRRRAHRRLRSISQHNLDLGRLLHIVPLATSYGLANVTLAIGNVNVVCYMRGRCSSRTCSWQAAQASEQRTSCRTMPSAPVNEPAKQDVAMWASLHPVTASRGSFPPVLKVRGCLGNLCRLRPAQLSRSEAPVCPSEKTPGSRTRLCRCHEHAGDVRPCVLTTRARANGESASFWALKSSSCVPRCLPCSGVAARCPLSLRPWGPRAERRVLARPSLRTRGRYRALRLIDVQKKLLELKPQSAQVRSIPGKLWPNTIKVGPHSVDIGT